MSNTDDDSPARQSREVQWAQMSAKERAQQARYTDQIRLIIDGLNASLQDPDSPQWRGPAASIAAYPDPADLAATEFLYRTDTILVSPDPDDQALVADVLQLPGGFTDIDRTRVPQDVDWVRVLPLPADQPWAGDGAGGSPAEQALRSIEDATGRLDLAGFDRVVHLAPGSNSGCPATEPLPVFPPPPGGTDPAQNRDATLGRYTARKKVRVAVIDSGIPQGGVGAASSRIRDLGQTPANPRPSARLQDQRWPWLDGVTGELEDAPAPNPGAKAASGLRGHYRGHGLFVAGVVRAMAPAARVHVFAWGPTTYGQIESELAPILDRVLDAQPAFDIISMSAGTRVELRPRDRTRSPDANRLAARTQPAFGLDRFLARLADTHTLLVCAAGNNGDQGPFVPASSGQPATGGPRCKVAVGALKKNGRLARYSNRGSWVDVYARGSHVVNAYPDGYYAYMESPLKGTDVTFTNGLADWSGTSFATPLVAGLVAARMSWSKETPRQAWESLSRIADQNAPFGLATLGPGDADRGVHPPS